MSTMVGTWVYDEASLRDFLGLVLFHAPNEFPEEDFLPADEQLNLDRAFQEIHHGLKFVRILKGDPERMQRAKSLVDQAYAQFAANALVHASETIYQLEDCLGFRTDIGYGYGEET